MRISDWSSDVCSSDLHALLQTTALEDGEIDRRADGEEPGIPTVEVVELEGFDADSSPQADPRVEIGFGDADGRRCSMELGFGALYVRPPDRKSVVEGKSGSVRVDLGGSRIIKTKKDTKE